MTSESEDQLSVAPSGESGNAPAANPPVRSLAQLESSQAAMRSAARVLSAGYTTFEYIVSLVGNGRYLAQETRREKWEEGRKKIFGDVEAFGTIA